MLRFLRRCKLNVPFLFGNRLIHDIGQISEVGSLLALLGIDVGALDGEVGLVCTQTSTCSGTTIAGCCEEGLVTLVRLYTRLRCYS